MTVGCLVRVVRGQALFTLAADQYKDWRVRYGSKQELFRDQQLLFIGRQFGQIVGTASVAATPYRSLGSDGRPRASRSPSEIKAAKRDSSALVYVTIAHVL